MSCGPTCDKPGREPLTVPEVPGGGEAGFCAPFLFRPEDLTGFFHRYRGAKPELFREVVSASRSRNQEVRSLDVNLLQAPALEKPDHVRDAAGALVPEWVQHRVGDEGERGLHDREIAHVALPLERFVHGLPQKHRVYAAVLLVVGAGRPCPASLPLRPLQAVHQVCHPDTRLEKAEGDREPEAAGKEPLQSRPARSVPEREEFPNQFRHCQTPRLPPCPLACTAGMSEREIGTIYIIPNSMKKSMSSQRRQIWPIPRALIPAESGPEETGAAKDP